MTLYKGKSVKGNTTVLFLKWQVIMRLPIK